MMRAWLESAATGCAPRKSELTRMTRMEGNSLREVIFTPSRGSGSIVRRFADGARYQQHASSYRLARGGWRQGQSAARYRCFVYMAAWHSMHVRHPDGLSSLRSGKIPLPARP